jgi:hypothetical protein
MRVDIDKNILKSLLIQASAVEAKDPYTGGHLWRVSQFAKLIAEKISLTKEDIFLVCIGGFLHDLGKIHIPDSILTKKGRLTDEEYEIIRTHTRIGYELIKEHPLAILAQDTILHHHEHFDGSGYPDNLAENDTHLFSRIVSVADAFDAMTSTRSYREGLSIEESKNLLIQERNKQFDARLVDSFLEIELEKIFSIVGHTEPGIPLLPCSLCGPTVVISENLKDGDRVFCTSCGAKLILNKNKSSYELEPTGDMENPEKLKCRIEISAIEVFTAHAPSRVMIYRK